MIALNRHLALLVYSCLQHARYVVEDYKELTGGIVDWEQDQDFELESYIRYYRPLALVEEQEAVISRR